LDDDRSTKVPTKATNKTAEKTKAPFHFPGGVKLDLLVVVLVESNLNGLDDREVAGKSTLA